MSHINCKETIANEVQRDTMATVFQTQNSELNFGQTTCSNAVSKNTVSNETLREKRQHAHIKETRSQTFLREGG